MNARYYATLFNSVLLMLSAQCPLEIPNAFEMSKCHLCVVRPTQITLIEWNGFQKKINVFEKDLAV